jgi:putative membrane protein
MVQLGLVAQMWEHGEGMDGRGWWWLMGIGWLVLVVGMLVIGVLLLRHFTQSNGPAGQPRSNAEDILAQRFARGEIDEDEFQRRRAALRQSG